MQIDREMLEEVEAALAKISNTGQTSQPDHWLFRQMAHSEASAALARLRKAMEGKDG